MPVIRFAGKGVGEGFAGSRNQGFAGRGWGEGFAGSRNQGFASYMKQGFVYETKEHSKIASVCGEARICW